VKYLVVGLIIGLIIGAAIGYSIQKPGVPIEEYESIMAELQMLKKPLKVGFIYVGPVGDWGWTHAHDTARRYIERIFPWVENIYVLTIRVDWLLRD